MKPTKLSTFKVNEAKFRKFMDSLFDLYETMAGENGDLVVDTALMALLINMVNCGLSGKDVLHTINEKVPGMLKEIEKTLSDQ